MLHAVLDTTLPVFALILAGVVAAKLKLLGPEATVALNRFVVYLALLFAAMAGITRAQIDHPGFIAAFGLGMLAVFAVSVALARRAGRSLADASIEGLAAGYPNTAYLGLPLSLMAFGPAGTLPAIIASIMTVSILFALAMMLIEFATQATPRLAPTLARTAGALLRNPIVAAPLLGGILACGGWPLPAPASVFCHMLGDTAGPCALVTLGLFLAQSRAGCDTNLVCRLAFLKLAAQPALTFILAYGVFRMPPLWAASAVFLSALPTGTGPFMLAEFYQREAALTARVILVTTLISLATTSLLIAHMAPKP